MPFVTRVGAEHLESGHNTDTRMSLKSVSLQTMRYGNLLYILSVYWHVQHCLQSQLHGLFIVLIQEMLWTAPELLRLSEKEQIVNGTRTGDIYSLGLIIQEIVFRCLPFQAENHDPEGEI